MLVDTVSRPPRACADDTDWDLFAACAKTARGTLSANTERAMRSDLAIYAAWCTERGVPALPASAETIAAFVDAMAKARAPATVRRYVASIAAARTGPSDGRRRGEPSRCDARSRACTGERAGARRRRKGSPRRCASACSTPRAMS